MEDKGEKEKEKEGGGGGKDGTIAFSGGGASGLQHTSVRSPLLSQESAGPRLSPSSHLQSQSVLLFLTLTFSSPQCQTNTLGCSLYQMTD